MPANIQGIEFEIKGSTEKASESIDRLTESLGVLKGALGSGLKATRIKKDLDKINESAKKAMGEISKKPIEAKVETKGARKSKKELREVSAEAKNTITSLAQLKKLQEQYNDKVLKFSGFKKWGEGMKNPKSGLEGFAKNFSRYTKFANVFSSISSSASKAIRPITAVGGALVGLTTRFVKAGAGVLGFTGRLVSIPFKKAISSIGNFVKKLHSVVGAFKRIAFYRFIRTLIKEITQAFTEGVKSLYDWSAAGGGEFARSMDMMATSMNYFKNSIGAMVAPLINALAPALDFVIDKVVDFLNVINQLFAKLTGASYWTRAKKVATQYGEAAEDAAGGVGSVGKAAKEALKYLAPFDELNVLPSDTDSTSGRGGGGGGGGAADLGESAFEYVETFNEGISNFVDNIKAKIEESDWKGLGELLGNKVNEMVENVPWAQAGTKFGGFINSIITTEYWTLETINFTNIGNGIAQFVNNALDNIDFNIWGRLLIRKFTAAIDLLVGFINGLNTDSVSNAISGFINGAIDETSSWLKKNKTNIENIGTQIGETITKSVKKIKWGEAGTALSNGVNTVINTAKNFLDNLDTFTIGKSIQEFFRKAFRGINWDNIGDTIGTAINKLISFLSGLLDGMSYSDWKQIGDKVGTTILRTINRINWEEAGSNFGRLLSGIVGVLKGALDKLFGNEENRNKITKAVEDFITAAIKEINWLDVLDLIVKGLETFLYYGSFGVLQRPAFQRGEINENTGEYTPWWETDEYKKQVEKNRNWLASLFGVEEVQGAELPVSLTPNAKKQYNSYSKDLEKQGKKNPIKTPSTVYATKMQNRIPDDQTKLPVTGNFVKVLKDRLSNGDKTIDTVSNFKTAQDNLNQNAKRFETTADFKKRNDFLTDADKAFGSRADFKTRKDLLSDKDKQFNTQANFDSRKDSLSAANKQFNTKANFNSRKDSLSAANKQFNTKANFTSYKNSLKNPTINGKLNVTSWDITPQAATKTVTRNGKTYTWQTTTRADGGVFRNGKWHPIESYASGGFVGGQMFIAREAGPELVGTLKGHTAVMNNDQIVASVSAGVARAIAGIKFSLKGLTDPMAQASAIMAYQTEAIESAIDNATNRLAPYMQEDEDVEGKMYSAMMRAMSEQEREPIENTIYLDGQIIYQDVVQQNNQTIMRTGANPLMQGA